MTRTRFVQKTNLCWIALAVLVTASPFPASARTPAQGAGAALGATLGAAHRHHAVGDSLVRCTLMQQPTRKAGRAASRRSARLFAPTSQAVFFAHAGDRCVWRAGAAVRG